MKGAQSGSSLVLLDRDADCPATAGKTRRSLVFVLVPVSAMLAVLVWVCCSAPFISVSILFPTPRRPSHRGSTATLGTGK